MLESVRARLAIWHTAVLAILLTGFALAAYAFLARTTARGAGEYLTSSANAFAIEMQSERDGAPSDSAAATAAVAEFRVRDLGVVIFDEHGHRIAASNGGIIAGATSDSTARRNSSDELSPGVDFARLRAAVLNRSATQATAHEITFMLPDAEGGYRISLTRAAVGRSVYRVAMLQSRHAEAETLDNARIACLIAIPIMLVAAGIGGSFLAKHSLEPVAAMTEQAAQISAANLSDRLPVINPRDELGRLAIVINDLLSRVGQSLEQQRRFMADASHELRTPVSIMRAEAEVALSAKARSLTEYRESLGVVGDTAARLSTVVNELFLLARADAGQQPLQRCALYLDDIVTECTRAVRALALRSGVTIYVTADIDAPFNGDDELLRRLVTNLLDNAVKYSGRGTIVTVKLSETPDAYCISVRDTGPGIPVDAQTHLFERFFRADVARSRAAFGDGSTGGGAGLGLAIAQWVAHAHNGRVELESSTAAGTAFAVWLPRETHTPH